MEAMLQELKATVVRLPGEAAVPQAVADYLKSENLPPKLRLAPRDDLRHLPWDSAPLLEVEEGIAEADEATRSEEHTSELQSLMRITYDVICLKKKTTTNNTADVQSDTTA